ERHPIPFAGRVAQMVEKGAIGVHLRSFRGEHSAKLGDVGVGPEKLEMTKAERPDSRSFGDHHRRDGAKLSRRTSHGSYEKLVLDGKLALTKVRPPRDHPIPGREGENASTLRLEAAPIAFERDEGAFRFDFFDDQAAHRNLRTPREKTFKAKSSA